MSKRIYVGNLPFSATEGEIRALFADYGDIESVHIVNDRETGRPRGFAFVEMPDAAASAAVEGLTGAELGGRTLEIDEARPRQAPRVPVERARRR
jgi:RNA recognition motif-containing protein